MELALVKSSISIEIHTSDNGYQKSVTSVNAALDKETLQVARVNEAEVAVIEHLVTRLKVEVIRSSEVLLKHLTLAGHLQLLLDKLGKASLHIVGKELVW